MSSSMLYQWSWLDPTLRPASDEDTTTFGREASPPKEPSVADRPAAATLTIEDIEVLSGVLHCEIVDSVSGGRRVAQVYTLPDPLPCPWPPMGPFSTVRLEDLQMREVPLDVILDLKKVSDGVEVLKWRAFEPQTKSFGAKPLSTTTNTDAGIPVLSQDAKQEQRLREGKQGDEDDVVDAVDIATNGTISAPSKNRTGGQKRAIEEVDGAAELPERRTKTAKRKYIHDVVGTLRTTAPFNVV